MPTIAIVCGAGVATSAAIAERVRASRAPYSARSKGRAVPALSSEADDVMTPVSAVQAGSGKSPARQPMSARRQTASRGPFRRL